jgi:S1-C subfamily serine protease
MEYFVLKGHDTTGPFSEKELRRAFAGRRLDATDLVQPKGERHWTPLRKLLDRLDEGDVSPSHEPGEPSIAEVLATMAPGLFAMIGANPVSAGLAGVALAALLAYLARWPLLVALPGVVLGVAAGIILVMRHRPLVGVIISLAAMLLPIALAPKTRVVVAESHEIVSAPPAAAPAEAPKALASSEVPKPAPDPAVEAPIAVAIPELPPVVENRAPESTVPQTPPPARTEPGKMIAAIAEKLRPAPKAPEAPAPAQPGPDKITSANAPANPPIPPIPQLPPLPAIAPRPSAAQPSRPEDLVFLIETDTGRGTGFLAADQGRVYFFTNLHVVSGAKKIAARSNLATFEFKDGNVDVATDRDLVRFAVPAQPALQFGETPAVDDEVVALGNSGGREVVTRLEGKVLGVGPAQIEVSSEFIPGNSGGPIVGKDNRVLGIATYVLRGESVPDWIKTGTRFSTTRRFGVRVMEDVKWDSVPLGTLLRQTAIQHTGEEVFSQYIAVVRTLSEHPLSQQITTKLSERSEVRFFVDDYNRACRDFSSRARSNINKTDFYARMRDHVGKLGRSIRSTAQGLRRDLGTTSKGYLKKEETELLDAYDKLATAIEKDERDLFHL